MCCMGASVKMEAKVAYSSVLRLSITGGLVGFPRKAMKSGAHSDGMWQPRLTSRPDHESRIMPLLYSACDLQEGLNLSKPCCLCPQHSDRTYLTELF